MPSFFVLLKTCFFEVLRESGHLVLTVKNGQFVAGTINFRIVYSTTFLNVGQQNGVTWKDMLGISTFRAWEFVAGPCLSLIFSSYLFIDIWCNISKNVNHVSD